MGSFGARSIADINSETSGYCDALPVFTDDSFYDRQISPDGQGLMH